MCNLKTQHNRIMCSSNITVIQVYAPTPNAEEDEVDWFQEDLQHLLELTPKKKKKKEERKKNSFSSEGTGMQK